jgi:hypothetical protein
MKSKKNSHLPLLGGLITEMEGKKRLIKSSVTEVQFDLDVSIK